MMTDIHASLRAAEPHLEGFRRWRAEQARGHALRDYAWWACSAEELFRCAALLYPEFIEVEGAVILADCYDPATWPSARAAFGDPFHTAAMLNHRHLEGIPRGDGTMVAIQEDDDFDDAFGDLLAEFWQIAADRQFPTARVKVWWNGYTLHIAQPERMEPPAS